jgi:hypothetical protein
MEPESASGTIGALIANKLARFSSKSKIAYSGSSDFRLCRQPPVPAVVAHYATVDLVQQDAKGNTILTINLTDTLISSYQISGSQSYDSPQESMQIDFRKICISEPGSGDKLCFDRSTNTAS